jgi:hypothetical protein
MRPLGHDNARVERDASLMPTGVEQAWLQYTSGSIYLGEGVRSARALLEPVRPTLDQLHALLLRLPPDVRANGFGEFLSAGYALVPEEEITYPFDTPEIANLGTDLFMKRLVITGTVGHWTGNRMVGELDITGTAGDCVGSFMIGKLINNGVVGLTFGYEMIGTLVNHAATHYPGHNIIGVVRNYGRIVPSSRNVQERWRIKPTLIDTLWECGTRKPHTPWRKEKFLREVANPNRLSYKELHKRLVDSYDPGWQYR